MNSSKNLNCLNHDKRKSLIDHGIEISLGRQCELLVIIERFWGSLKQEKIYLIELNSVHDARIAIDEYMVFYNFSRKHQSLGYETPNNVYYGNL